MRLTSRTFKAGLTALATACSLGTETGNPGQGDLVGFEDSGCKNTAGVSASGGSAREALVGTPDYDGLSCIEWDRRSDGALTLRLLNFSGGCEVSWRGEATVTEAGTLELVLENRRCMVAACGSCLYDFRFDVKNVESTAGQSLRIGFRDCAGEPVRWDFETELPPNAGDAGIVCRYAPRSALEQFLMEQGRCGERWSPCGAPIAYCGEGSEAECRGGLVCVEATSSDDRRCHEPCSTSAECVPAGVTECADGSCRPVAGW